MGHRPALSSDDAVGATAPVRELPGRLGLGTANLGNLYRAMTDEQAWALLETAWDCGVRHFDTAPHYGLGLSERRLGAFLATKPRDAFVVSTKVGRLLRPHPEGAGTLDSAHDYVVPADLTRVWDLSADGVRRSLEESLQRLELDRVDVVYLHDPEVHDLRQGVTEALPALVALREEEVVTAVGVGSMANAALLAGVEEGDVDLLMVAGRWTLADQSAGDTVLPACQARGTAVVAAAVFNSGLLASDTPSAADRFDYGPVKPGLLARVQRVAEVCASFDVPLRTAALHYPLRHPAVTAVVVGGAVPEHVRDNVARLAAPVPEELWVALRGEGLTT